MDRRIKSAAACAASVMLVGLISGQRASAAPYASMISESGGDITFTLNEPADDVVIIRDGVPTSLGPLGTGSHTVPRSGAASYSIRATKTAAAGFFNQTGNTSGITGLSDGTPTAPALQISDDNNLRNSFHAVRGVAVNRNPANGASFGWVYVSNANTNTTGGFPTPVRSVSDGIYVNGADGSDPLNQGDTALNPGLNFAASESPYRIALDKDGFLYIADWSDTSGTVYRTNNTVTVGSQLLAGSGGAAPFAPSAAQTHGSVAAVYVEGTSAAGNLTLFTIDEDMTPDPVTPTQRNGLWRYDIGAGTTTNNTTIPTLLNGSYGQIDFVSQTMSMTRGPDGKFYITDFRFDGNESGLFVLSPTGASLYRSRTDAIQRNFDEDPALTGLQDPFRTMRDVAVSPDGQWIAALRGDGTVFVAPLIDGIPDMPNRTYVPTFDPINFGRDLDFDAAGNLYVVSSGNQALRVFSPGKVSLTTYKSDGSFEVHNEPEWFATTGGNVSSPANWMLGYLPNGVSEIAKFGRMTTSAATITIDSPITLGMLKIDNPNHSYTIAGSSTITLDAFGEPRITAISGSHTITAPVLANKNIQLSAAAGATLTVNNLSLSGGPAGTVSISTGGSGTVIVPNFRAGGGLTVRYGTAQVAAGTTANSAAGA
ncbi:MAG TPA: hypothetical protein VNL70_11320, partial [Tepidisphaeraceae bacterium]|nr:hypothetical protein [Tepidisphaeraceae bacterium]